MAIRFETKKAAEPEKPATAKPPAPAPRDEEAAPPEDDALPFAKPVRPVKKRKGSR